MATQTPIKFSDLFQPYEDCICLRKRGQNHCPHCGSANARACPGRATIATLPDGRVLDNMVWNCRRCGEYYDCIAKITCSAPVPQEPSKKAPKAKQPTKVVEGMTPEELGPEALAVMEKWRKKLQNEG